MSARRRFAAISLVFAVLAVMIGCSSDNNNSNPPVTGTLNGQVIFQGQWPDSGDVQISLFSNWNVANGNCSWCPAAANGPPAYYTAALQDPDPGNGDGPDTVTFTITGITLGSYQAVAAGWRKPTIQDPNRDEPVIGLFGADPNTTDSLPSTVTFSDGDPTQDVVVHAYFAMLPHYSATDTVGLIGGIVHISDAFPASGLTVVLTTYPYTPWFIPQGPPAAYFTLLTASDSIFSFAPFYGTYYLSVFTHGGGQDARWHGAFGVNTAAGDARPDPITISALSPASIGNLITAYGSEPHYISGTITFNGSRPPEGILALLSTFPYSPEHAPQGAPTAYYPITDSNETLYAFTGIAEGTYYVSLWSNTPPPGVPTFYGAYGYIAGGDTDPDPLEISSSNWGYTDINVTGGP